MIFGGLSEQEVEAISTILSDADIKFEVKEDSMMMESNADSMKYDLRHLASPSISTHVLSIHIDLQSFENLDPRVKEKLLKHGITDEVPEELSHPTDEVRPIQSELNRGTKRLVGHNFLHQILIGLGAFIIYFILKKLF